MSDLILPPELLDQYGATLANFADPRWRINNLYQITDANGQKIPFRMNQEQEELFDSMWYFNIILKARQMGFCYDPSTKVLTEDLRWVRIDDLEVGQGIVSVEENIPGGRGKGRKMLSGVIEGKRDVKAEAFRIIFDDGRELIATAAHRHLCKNRGGTEAVWREVGKTRVGDEIRYITTSWEGMSYDDGWMAGILDGEGCLRSKASGGCEVTITQVDGAVLSRAKAYLDREGYVYREEIDVREPGSSKLGSRPVHKLVVSRTNDVFRLIGKTRPSRLVGSHWWEGKDLPGKRSGQAWAKVISIESVGVRRMVDLQTSTKTFIANGFVSHNSTFIGLMAVDQCLFVPNTRVGIIAQTEDDVRKLFRNKVRNPYKDLPQSLRDAIGLVSINETEIRLGNGSSLQVGMSLRSDTLTFLHVSEFGKICAKAPERAREVVTGALPAVAVGNMVFIESTAEGQEGHFHRYCMEAIDAKARGAKLSQRSFRIHFFAWWQKKNNRLDPETVEIGDNDHLYFGKLAAERGIILDDWQKAWYVNERKTLAGDMHRENPSYPEEAFQAALEGAYYEEEMLWLRQNNRIGVVPWDPALPVNTFWDFGVSTNNETVIWFHQRNGLQDLFVEYYEERGKGLKHFVDYMKSTGYTFGVHYLPHDANARLQTDQEQAKTRLEMLEELLPGHRFEVVPRVSDVNNGIELTKQRFPKVWMDKEKCAKGIAALDSYQRTWNTRLAQFTKVPLHNWASNGADGFRCYGQGYSPTITAAPSKAKKRAAPNWRVL